MTPHGGAHAASRRRSAGGGGGTPAVWQNPPPINVDQALDPGVRNIVVPGGPFPRKSAYNAGSPPADSTYSCSNDSEFSGVMAWDAENSQNANARCTAVVGSTICSDATWRANTKPFRVGLSVPRTGIYVVRGLVAGADPETLTWGQKKTGDFIQDEWDAGNLVNTTTPTSDGNGVTLGMKNGGWMAVDGVRMHNVMDGINLRGDQAAVSATTPFPTTSWGTCYVRNVYVNRARDTAFTSEQGHLFRAFDCLVDSAYGLIDHRNGPNASAQAHVWEYCLFRLMKMQGGFKKARTLMYHNVVDKRDAGLSPTHHFLNCTVAVEDSSEDPLFPSNGLYTGTTICWLGAGAYPFSTPAGATVLTGQAAIDHWNGKRSGWLSRHGMTAWNAVTDYDLLIHAQPPAA